jgi:hypothetical protein
MKKTIKDLIEFLTAIEDKEIFIELEGCDCINEWNGEATTTNYGSLLLEIS